MGEISDNIYNFSQTFLLLNLRKVHYQVFIIIIIIIFMLSSLSFDLSYRMNSKSKWHQIYENSINYTKLLKYGFTKVGRGIILFFSSSPSVWAEVDGQIVSDCRAILSKHLHTVQRVLSLIAMLALWHPDFSAVDSFCWHRDKYLDFIVYSLYRYMYVGTYKLNFSFFKSQHLFFFQCIV